MASIPSLLTVTLNPAVDRNYEIEGFQAGGVYVPSKMSVTAGGKGVNVARVWKALGGTTVATGFIGGAAGRFIAERVAEQGIGSEFVEIARETRTAFILEDSASGHELIVNERGPTADESEQSLFLDKLRSLVQGFDFVAICGSAPVGVASEYYARVVEIARSGDATVLLDAAGENLICGAKAGAHIVKPNAVEATALGANIETWTDAPCEALKLSARYGIETVLLSGGSNGAVLASGGAVWSVTPPRIDVVSTVGCGDSMSSGLLWGLAQSPDDWAGALRWAVAVGTANALTFGAGEVSISDILGMWGRIESTRLA